MNQKTFVSLFYPRDGHIRQAVCSPAVCAGEVRVALGLAAIVRQLEVPGPFFDKCPVHQADFYKGLQRSIDCHLVKSLFTQSSGDLFLRQGLIRIEQGM
jgi:hypothetical protein